MATAPLTLHTGKPGNGKTLYTLWHVKKRAEEEGRPVFYSGIKDLKLPWTEIEADKWYECPAGSIIVIDEAQRVFRPRSNGSQVPKHVEALETLRHQGFDLYLITQHPLLIDANARRLCGIHRHMIRAFGFQGANIHEFSEVRENVDKSRTGSIETKFPYPREVYNYYQSAEVHTIKGKLPRRVYFLLLMPLLLAACLYFFYNWFVKSKNGPQNAAVTASQQKTGPGQGNGAATQPAATAKPVGDYIAERSPRIDNQPWSAPIYDDVTKPTEAPTPVACVQNHKTGTCRCYDQQSATMKVSVEYCQSFIKDGAFIPWRTPRQQGNQLADNRQSPMPELQPTSATTRPAPSAL